MNAGPVAESIVFVLPGFNGVGSTIEKPLLAEGLFLSTVINAALRPR